MSEGPSFSLVDVKDLGKPIEKLFGVLASGCGAIWRLAFCKIIAEREGEAAKIAASKQLEVHEIATAAEVDAEIANKLIAANMEDISEYFEPDEEYCAISPFAEVVANQRAFHDARRASNVFRIANIAQKDLGSEVSEEPVDEDWISRFFDVAMEVSSEEMQALWGKVLAREVTSPGSFSLRSLGLLRTMTKKEAAIWEEMCAMMIDNQIVGRYSKGKGTHSFAEVLLMREFGLFEVETVSLNHGMEGLEGMKTKSWRTRGGTLFITAVWKSLQSRGGAQIGDGKKYISWEGQVFTTVGVELSRLVDRPLTEDEFNRLCGEVKRQLGGLGAIRYESDGGVVAFDYGE